MEISTGKRWRMWSNAGENKCAMQNSEISTGKSLRKWFTYPAAIGVRAGRL